MFRLLIAATLFLACLSASAAPSPRYLYVAGEGDGIANGVALIDAVATTAESPGEPWLIQLGPGFFNVSPKTLELPPEVNLIGAGRRATIIRLNVTNADHRPTLRLSNRNEISRLEVVGVCFGMAQYCTAIEVAEAATSVRLNDVSVFASGGPVSNVGVAAYGPLTIDDSIVYAQTGKRAVALELQAAGWLQVNGSELWAASASQSCEVIGGRSTAVTSSEIRYSTLIPRCFAGADDFWHRATTSSSTVLRFSSISRGLRSGPVACTATDHSSGFLPNGCPN